VTVRAWRDSVWVVDAVRGTLTRVTSGERQASTPVWTPDGRHVIYSTTGVAAPGGDSGGANLFRADADGNLREERLTTSPNSQVPDSVSTDGAWLVFTESTGYATDLFLLSLAGDGAVRPLVQTRYDERSGAISPDGRWLAYQSNRSGTNEVYVADFPAIVASTQISTDGGTVPVWARDGRHLYYRGAGPAVMAVDSVGAGWAGVANPRRVADAPRMGPVQGYDVMPDGRFLVVDGQNHAGRSELRVVLNWFNELRQKVPTP
jgi:serine/threonine-protein kinase